MTEKGVGKPWTTDEDKLLIQAVAIHGENDNWKAVAVSVPGRTNKACRKVCDVNIHNVRVFTKAVIAMASFALPECQEVRVDSRRGWPPSLAICYTRDKVVRHRPPDTRQDR